MIDIENAVEYLRGFRDAEEGIPHDSSKNPHTDYTRGYSFYKEYEAVMDARTIRGN